MADNSRRRWWQFSLRTIFWLMLLIAVGLAAYRHGFDAGRKYKEPSSKPYLLSVYTIPELQNTGTPESPSPKIDEVAALVRKNVLPKSWRENGGKARIMQDKAHSLMIYHDRSGHEQVREYLRSLVFTTESDESTSP